jgi:predicted dinucleotide-binding enzyme
MRIGILGSGDVGRKLADSFIEIRHLVKIGSRNANQEKLTEWMAKHDKAKVSLGTFCRSSFVWLTKSYRNVMGWNS